ncbi:MAG: PEP-utilizing enzyme [Bacteroidia bacterium]|nr:PEP-utilizing enzyme [Bacteroidia bacterium]
MDFVKFIFYRSPFDIKSNPIFSGGKGFNLLHLSDYGFKVPEFVVYNAQQIDISKPLSEVELQEIKDYLGSPKFVSVRSSALGEDSGSQSFAGQFLTQLNVEWDQVNQAITHVWSSLKRPEVVAYCHEHGIEPPQKMGIVIQRMLNPTVSGVAFGMNPVNGKRKEIVISAVCGLGEGLVSGELNSDTYILDSITGNLIDSDFQASPETKLTPNQLKHICKVLSDLKALYKKPQDIEFCWENDQFYLLQSRPITTLNQTSDQSSEMILWDNSNIIESYPGVTTPLTFSFIIKMYESVYIQLCSLLGVSEADLTKNAGVFANMLGLINGRVYYNLLSWYKALALLPGYHLNAEFMEKMMGVKERFELKDLPKRSKWTERARVLIMIKSMISNLRALPKMRVTFQADFQKVMDEFNQIPLHEKDSHELMELILRFEQTLLKKWKAPLVNDFYAMIYFGFTQKLAEKYQLPDGIHNQLLSSAGDIISVEPIHQIEKIVDKISKHWNWVEFIVKATPEEILKAFETDRNFENVLKEFNYYIDKFGDRTVGELKLETITYRQDPAMFAALIQSHVRYQANYITSRDPSYGQPSHKELRKQGEDIIKETFKDKPIKRRIFNYVLGKTREMVSARENLRFERTRGFGKIRELFLAIGNQFYGEGIIKHSRDIFYLTQEEIFDYIKGTSVTPEIADLIEFRKVKYQGYESQNTSERIRTFGNVYHANSFVQETKSSLEGADLKGIGCCPGIVRAKVRIVKDPREISDLNGDILVTSSTDPGWVMLFPTASGILVERGSLLSHSAIVSRELGKPCIVGITNLLNQLNTGDFVEMNGATGEIKIVFENSWWDQED